MFRVSFPMLSTHRSFQSPAVSPWVCDGFLKRAIPGKNIGPLGSTESTPSETCLSDGQGSIVNVNCFVWALFQQSNLDP